MPGDGRKTYHEFCYYQNLFGLFMREAGPHLDLLILILIFPALYSPLAEISRGTLEISGAQIRFPRLIFRDLFSRDLFLLANAVFSCPTLISFEGLNIFRDFILF